MTPDISTFNIVNVKLTQYSHGAGCGCKISPKVLDQILASNLAMPDNNK
ncbi:MAG: selenide, water dikinase SelD, partial [Deinococcales bacterium]|nr:selenide, water dikinase SelD [Chitinophagaceae bacterium]